jgi:hypothetical protein
MTANDGRGRLEGSDADIWNKIIGPVYDRAGLEKAFGCTTEQIDSMVKEDALLELVTLDGMAFFPASGFDDEGRPPPRLSEVITKLRAKDMADPWGMVMWLSSKPPQWDGRSALELLRTEWADEVVAQASEHGRSPLRARTEQLALIAIARPILDRFVELVADLPVDVAQGTLFVTRETEEPYGVFAMSIEGAENGFRATRFPIDGDPDETAEALAAMVRSQLM